MQHSSTQGRRNVAGLRRDLELLEALAQADTQGAGGLSVTQLAARTSRDKGQVSRSLATLGETGFVTRDASTKLYALGPRLYDLASRTAEARLVRVGKPFVREVVLATHETVELCVLRAGVVRTLAIEESPHAFRGLGWDGVGIPAWQSHTGRTLMSDWADGDLKTWFAEQVRRDREALAHVARREGELDMLAPGPARTIVTGEHDFLAAIHRIREHGYALDDEGVEVGVVGASAPVHDFHGHIVAALSLTAPKSRVGHRLEEVGEHIARIAQRCSDALGAAIASERRRSS